MRVAQTFLTGAMLATALFCVGARGAESASGKTDEAANESAAKQESPAVPSQPAEATAGSPAKEQEKRLQARLTLFTWICGLSTDITKGDTSVSADMKFSDIVEIMDFANFAHFQVQRGRWGVFSELDFVKLSEDTEFRKPSSGILVKIPADNVIKQTMAELGGFRSFGGERVGFDVLAGARYFRLESEANIGPFESRVCKDWVDPMIGGRLRWGFSEKLEASLRADVAGFGAGSELTTHVLGALYYNISDRYTLGLGYRYLDIDYEEDDLNMDMTTEGPVIGMSIRF